MATSTKSLFERLPTELRVKIYKDVFESQERDEKWPLHALLQTSKQIRADCAPVFMQNLTLVIVCWEERIERWCVGLQRSSDSKQLWPWIPEPRFSLDPKRIKWEEFLGMQMSGLLPHVGTVHLCECWSCDIAITIFLRPKGNPEFEIELCDSMTYLQAPGVKDAVMKVLESWLEVWKTQPVRLSVAWIESFILDLNVNAMPEVHRLHKEEYDGRSYWRTAAKH